MYDPKVADPAVVVGPYRSWGGRFFHGLSLSDRRNLKATESRIDVALPKQHALPPYSEKRDDAARLPRRDAATRDTGILRGLCLTAKVIGIN